MKTLKMCGLSTTLALVAVVGAGTASATTLKVGAATQSSSVTLVGTLEPGSSAHLKDSIGTTDTCTKSEVQGSTEKDASGDFSGATVTGTVSVLTFSECSHTTTVLSKGKLHVQWISGADNGTVSSSSAEVTIFSTPFSVSAVCKTGTGTDIGTLTGKTSLSEHATMDVNAKINCGILGTATWTAAYSITSPTGLSVVN